MEKMLTISLSEYETLKKDLQDAKESVGYVYAVGNRGEYWYRELRTKEDLSEEIKSALAEKDRLIGNLNTIIALQKDIIDTEKKKGFTILGYRIIKQR